MNDDQGATSTGRGSPDQYLKDLGKELQKLATDKKIEEGFDDKSGDAVTLNNIVIKDKSELPEGYDNDADCVQHANGRVEVKRGSYHTVYWPRTSEAWKEVHDAFDPIIETLVNCAQYNYPNLGTPISYMDKVCTRFEQKQDSALEDYAKEVSEREKDSGEFTKDDVTALKEILTSGGSQWAVIGKVSSDLEEWQGEAAEVFRLTYMERLPDVLIGQMVLAIALRETLEVAKAAYEGAKADGEALAQAAIDALDTKGTELAVNWSETLQVVQKVASLAAAGTAFTPGTQAFSAVAGLVAASAGAAGYVVKKYEKNTGDKAPKITLDAEDADSLMDEVMQRSGDIQISVVDIEQAAAEMLQELYDLATSEEDAKPVYPNGIRNGIQLSVREAFFEPRAPGSGSAMGDLIGAFGDNDEGNDPSYGELKGKGSMGTPDSTGAALAAPLYELWLAGETRLPGLADEYEDTASDLSGIDSIASDGFLRAFGGGEDGMSSNNGPLSPKWVLLHNELHGIVKGSAANLNAVGKVLVATAVAFAEQDEAAAKEIQSEHDDFPKV